MHVSDCYFSRSIDSYESTENTIINRRKHFGSYLNKFRLSEWGLKPLPNLFEVALIVDCLDKELVAYPSTLYKYCLVLSFSKYTSIVTFQVYKYCHFPSTLYKYCHL